MMIQTQKLKVVKLHWKTKVLHETKCWNTISYVLGEFFSFALKVKTTELNFNYINKLKFLLMALLQINEPII